MRDVLNHLRLAPTQIVRNSWKHLIGCAALWAAMSDGKTSLSKEVFLNQYVIKEVSNGCGWWYFTRRLSEEKEDLVTDIGNCKQWKDKFFFVGGTEWEFPNGDGEIHTPRVLSKWGIPSPNGKLL